MYTNTSVLLGAFTEVADVNFCDAAQLLDALQFTAGLFEHCISLVCRLYMPTAISVILPINLADPGMGRRAASALICDDDWP